MVDEKNLGEICRLHGWPEDEFIAEVKKFLENYGYSEEGALAQTQRHFTRKFGLHAKKPTLADFMPEEPAPSQVVVEPPKIEVKPEGIKPAPKEEPPKPEAKPAKANAYNKLVELVGHHLAEIYGVRGTGKSRLVHLIALEAQRVGKRVLFLDTEGGLDEKHIRQLENYDYIGDELDDLRRAVEQAKVNRDKYDLLIVDSIGHPVYVNYVTMGGMDAKLKSYQELAALFRDMVRFSRGERDKDMGRRFGLSIAVDHTVSEFARIAKDLPTEEPLDPFGGQIHRVPKFIVRSEPVRFTNEQSIFRLITWKARDLPKNLEVARFNIGKDGVAIDWKI